MRIAFFGTPAFAVPSLDALAAEQEVVLVVAQPDRPSGRGMKMHAPAVAVRAKELGIPLLQPPKIRTEEFLAQVRAAAPDLGVVVAYGRILPPSLLEIPREGFLNVHGSVLPKWRGAAPIQRAIEAGERETGVTIMRVDEELDHGAMLAVETLEIGPDEHTPSLAARLSVLGAETLARVLRDYANVRETPQHHEAATYAAKLDKSEGLIRWTDPAGMIYDKYRAFDPWPGVFTESMKLVEIARSEGSGAPGTVLQQADDGVVVACGDGALKLIAVQRPGKPPVPAIELARSGVLLP